MLNYMAAIENYTRVIANYMAVINVVRRVIKHYTRVILNYSRAILNDKHVILNYSRVNANYTRDIDVVRLEILNYWPIFEVVRLVNDSARPFIALDPSFSVFALPVNGPAPLAVNAARA